MLAILVCNDRQDWVEMSPVANAVAGVNGGRGTIVPNERSVAWGETAGPHGQDRAWPSGETAERGTGGPMGLPEAFRRLGSLRFDEESLEAVLRLVVCLSTAALPGTDATNVMVLRSSGLETVGAFDNCRDLDDVQSRSQRGPCYVAMREAETVDATVPATSSLWPEFAQVATEGGFRAVLALPLRTPDRVIGSLGLFSRHRQGFDDDTRVAAAIFADRAAVVLANATAFTAADLLNRHLGEALASRELIGRAKGILMERHLCGDNEAFDRLRQESQTTHRKLRDVAQGVAESSLSRHNKRESLHHR